VPADEEVLMQQFDLLQVRHPRLLRDAYRRLRHAQVADISVALPAEFHSDVRLPPARRGSYGVFPPDLNNDERAVAQLLDAHAGVRWWHRNLPSKADSLGLYRWDDGAGFFPDFVIALNDRDTPGGIALLELKGDQLWGKESEVDKAGAVHPDYGKVFMVGRRRGETGFSHLRELRGRLEPEAGFNVERLRFV
jgi:hypothetical protein